jgi:hypothetical protein
MSFFVIYSTTTGEITKQMIAPHLDHVVPNVGVGENYFETNDIVDESLKKIHLFNQTIIDKTAMTPSITEVAPYEVDFDGYCILNITGLPTGWSLEDSPGVSIESQAATTVELKFAYSATFLIAFNCPGYLRHTITVEVEDNRGDVLPVTVDYIKAKRDELEEGTLNSTVNAVSYTFHADVLSMVRMKEQSDNFANLPTLDVNDELLWFLADGTTVLLNDAELQAVYADLLDKKSIRRATLHAQCGVFIDDWNVDPETVTKDIVDDPVEWGL